MIKAAGGRAQLGWAVSADACLASYAVQEAVDPVRPALFPSAYTDVSAADEDPGATTFREPMPSGALVLWQVAGVGAGGTLGPP